MSVHSIPSRITLSDPTVFAQWPHIVREVAYEFGVAVEDLLGPGRRQPIAQARQYAYTRLRDETPMTIERIGEVFDRHHTTVLYGIRATRARLKGETQ